MKVTSEQLKSFEFYQMDESHTWYYGPNWDYQFNQLTNEFIYYNDDMLDDEPLTTITNYEHFKQVMDLIQAQIL